MDAMDGAEPVLRVERGIPDPAELAALVMVLSARDEEAAEDGRSPCTGPDWRDSGLPH